MRMTILAASLILTALAVSACTNTWHGAGEDVENVGEKMQNQYK